MSLETLLAAAKDLHLATPALRDFAPWPDDLKLVDKPPVPCPAQTLITALSDDIPLANAIKAAAELVEWRRTYSPDEVGQDFLNRYGYVELYGPHGHFHSTQARGYLAFWDAGLDYGWHHHEAEELYYSLHGTPEFLSKAKPPITLQPRETRHHAPWEIHGMKTHDTPFLCYALWRGPGLADLPEMET